MFNSHYASEDKNVELSINVDPSDHAESLQHILEQIKGHNSAVHEVADSLQHTLNKINAHKGFHEALQSIRDKNLENAVEIARHLDGLKSHIETLRGE